MCRAKDPTAVRFGTVKSPASFGPHLLSLYSAHQLLWEATAESDIVLQLYKGGSCTKKIPWLTRVEQRKTKQTLQHAPYTRAEVFGA